MATECEPHCDLNCLRHLLNTCCLVVLSLVIICYWHLLAFLRLEKSDKIKAQSTCINRKPYLLYRFKVRSNTTSFTPTFCLKNHFNQLIIFDFFVKKRKKTMQVIQYCRLVSTCILLIGIPGVLAKAVNVTKFSLRGGKLWCILIIQTIITAYFF